MKIAIVGSRDFSQLDLVFRFVAALPFGTTVMSGGARGVDRVAEQAARRRGLAVEIIRPDWNGLGRAAGMIRNTELVRRADQVVAFWDGRSPGTRDSIRKAKSAGKLYRVYDDSGLWRQSLFTGLAG